MDPDERLSRAASFETVAATYADHRPDYPEAAVRWLVGGDGRPMRVLELGAGTGKLTKTLSG
ncbi:MAG: SAM-dependent methyltransferase, partial [Actinomycetota bacterium]|nr:SAM-dependent methyltransferase [Actinomycetota bacterium]